MIALLVLLAAGALAQPAPNWLKTYTTVPYKQVWYTELTVTSLERDLPKAIAALEKNGGKQTQPLAAFAGGGSAQQMSWTISKAGAARALKALKKAGKAGEPRVSLPQEVVPLDEVKAKLAALEKERALSEKWAALPVSTEAVDELIARLRLVKEAQTRTDSEVLWNITVQEKR